jgi:hypothetical protein
MMVYLLDLQLVLWLVTEPFVSDVCEMRIVMETTQLDFFLEIQISPFSAHVVCFDLQVVELVEQPNLPTMVPIWPPVLGLESLQPVQVVVPPPKVAMILVWYWMP